jgi:dTMP kinase
MRGALIVVEGGDGAGKTTQCQLLVNALNERGHPAHLHRFPDRTTRIGHVIDAHLKQDTRLDAHAMHLLFSANRWECIPHVLELLESGTHVIMDRYAYSGVAFSVAQVSPCCAGGCG